MSDLSLKNYAKQQSDKIKTTLSKRPWLFDDSITVVEPTAGKEDTYLLKIPEIGLKEYLGYVYGTIRYKSYEGTPQLRSYSLNFAHLYTYVQFIEQRPTNNTLEIRHPYGFHYDYDREINKKNHPAHHLAMSFLRVPRFEVSERKELVALEHMLDLIQETFYINRNEGQADKKPKLECTKKFLTEFQ
jgi:hypothetical protein